MLANRKSQAMLIGVIVIVLIVAGIVLFTGNGDSDQEEQAPENEENAGSNITDEVIATHTVNVTANGFSPETLTIDQGDTVVFENTGEVEIWPAVDIHPTHQQYDGTSLSEHCGNGNNEVFDSCGNVRPGESYEFTFDKTGEWEYHDHTHNPNNKGTIVVE